MPSKRKPAALAGDDLQDAALREFHGLAERLERAGVEVLIASDSEQPPKPDAIFPNNWVSFHHDGTVTLYPMLAPNRRWERRDEVLEQVVRQGGFRVSRTVDLTHRESEDKYLEGTGSVVLDRAHRIAYASSSPRTDLDVLGEFAQQLDYELMTFDAVDAGGAAIYHTNVLMAIGTRLCRCLRRVDRQRGAPRGRAVQAALDRPCDRRSQLGANGAIRRAMCWSWQRPTAS